MRSILNPADYAHHVDYFNTMEPEEVINQFPNSVSWNWMLDNIPFFDCSDRAIEEMYYYRWWTFRKHIKETPAGRILTEFITPVRHAGLYNSISCALGHHLAEGRWIYDQSILDEYTLFWFTADEGKPEKRFHAYSSWLQWALYERAKVTGDFKFLINLLDQLIADYFVWESDKLITEGPYAGLFWQFDVRDGMEESITGSRKHKNARPTISSYMYANAIALAEIGRIAKRSDVVQIFTTKAAEIKKLVQEKLWDTDAQFFKAVFEEKNLSDAREAIDFVPWQFNLPDPGKEVAWKQLNDRQGFWGPYGITTAERRHPKFRQNGVGNCEWDGAAWPFATSQTLDALANVLRHTQQDFVSKNDYLEQMNIYVKSQRRNGRPYIGEYLDESTGQWLKWDNPRSYYYNHSTFNDLVIAGLVGLIPRQDETIELHPMLPEDSWNYFCLDGVKYHGKSLTIFFDQDGTRYNRGKGFSLLIDGKTAAQQPTLSPMKV